MPMSELADALNRSREMIRAALADAHAELAALDTRRGELRALIVQAEAALGEATQPTAETAAMTLHEALTQILRETATSP